MTDLNLLSLETNRSSFICSIFNSLWIKGSVSKLSVVRVYVISVLLTYGLLLVAAILSPLPLTEQTEVLRLPFLYDWNVAVMFLVSFPTLLTLTVTDQDLLNNSLRKIQEDDILSIPKGSAFQLIKRWEVIFRRANVASTVCGLIVGSVICAVNYYTYTREMVGFWITADGALLPVGYVFLYCIFLFYALIPAYIFRSITMIMFLKDLVARSQLQMLPLHPDNCGGLKPIGRLGLRNQYALTILGLNVVLFIMISINYLNVPTALYGLMWAAAIAYLILSPLVFIGPLLPFREGMLRMKSDLMSEVAQRLRIEITRIRGEIKNGKITKNDEEFIERLRKIGSMINELPVWPFDVVTLRKFLMAYFMPLISAISYPLLASWLSNLLILGS